MAPPAPPPSKGRAWTRPLPLHIRLLPGVFHGAARPGQIFLPASPPSKPRGKSRHLSSRLHASGVRKSPAAGAVGAMLGRFVSDPSGASWSPAGRRRRPRPSSRPPRGPCPEQPCMPPGRRRQGRLFASVAFTCTSSFSGGGAGVGSAFSRAFKARPSVAFTSSRASASVAFHGSRPSRDGSVGLTLQSGGVHARTRARRSSPEGRLARSPLPEASWLSRAAAAAGPPERSAPGRFCAAAPPPFCGGARRGLWLTFGLAGWLPPFCRVDSPEICSCAGVPSSRASRSARPLCASSPQRFVVDLPPGRFLLG